MERNEKTKAGRLKIGDRFYKLADKKKKAYQMVAGRAMSTQYMTYKLFCIPVDAVDNKLMTDKLRQLQISAILSNTEVVYLRSVGEAQVSA